MLRLIHLLAGLYLLPSVLAAEPAELIIEGYSQERDVVCEGKTLSVTGGQHRIKVAGFCQEIIIDGIGHVISIEGASRLEVWGADHTVAAERVGDLTVNGSTQKVTATVRDNPAAVTVSGGDNHIRVVLMTRAAVEVTGVQNTLLWQLGEATPPPQTQISGIGNNVQKAE